MCTGLVAGLIAGAASKPAPWFSCTVIEYVLPVFTLRGMVNLQAKSNDVEFHAQPDNVRLIAGPVSTARTSCPAASAAAWPGVIRVPFVAYNRKVTVKCLLALRSVLPAFGEMVPANSYSLVLKQPATYKSEVVPSGQTVSDQVSW